MRKILILALAASTLSACLANDGERALVGAATGAALAAATDGDIFTSALVGVAAGALCDELTGICR